MVMKKSLLSIKRKPSMPDSNAGSTTQTRFHPVPPTPTSDDWVGDQNHIARSNIRRQTMRKTRSQTKDVISVPVHSVSVKKTKNETKRSIEDVRVTVSVQHSYGGMENAINMDALFGMKFGDNRKAVDEVSNKCKGKEVEVVVTPINSAPPLRTKCNRHEFDGAKEALQSKPSTDPFPKNKKKKVLSKGSSRKFVMPYDFIDQQRAYFKEIDEYKLQVEEVEQVSVYEE